jgi:hypothetical protein
VAPAPPRRWTASRPEDAGEMRCSAGRVDMGGHVHVPRFQHGYTEVEADELPGRPSCARKRGDVRSPPPRYDVGAGHVRHDRGHPERARRSVHPPCIHHRKELAEQEARWRIARTTELARPSPSSTAEISRAQ